MRKKKNGVSRKSGFLTGLVIVSTGLIVGFHGFEMAFSENRQVLSETDERGPVTGSRSSRDVGRQVSALDRVITDSLEQAKQHYNGEDSRRLEKLIEAAQGVATGDRMAYDGVSHVSDIRPVVNRALKQDRDPVTRSAVNEDISDRELPSPPVEKIASAADATRAPLPDDVATKLITTDTRAPVKADKVLPDTVDNAEIPFADSADIALFAADMPLPSKLNVNMVQNSGLPLSSRRHRLPYGRSPLIPRTFPSGKAFGGLAEQAFQKRERRCMTTALYFEARSEPEAGQIAVGQVIMNRVKSPDYPDTICGVVYQGSNRRTGCQFSFTCDGKADKPGNKKQWEHSKRLANKVLEGQVWLKSIGNATHYHATYVSPRWRHKMARVKQIGRHIFYKSPKISITETYQRYISGQRS